MRIFKIIIYLISILAAILFISYLLQDKKIDANKNRVIEYELVQDWFKIPGNFILGNPTGLGIDTNENIVIFSRAGREWPLLGSMPDDFIKEKTILIVDRQSGEILSSWGDHLFIMPHGLTVDKDNNIWVTDVGLQQVFKFTHDGKLLMQLGEAKVPGDDSLHFNQPTDIAIAKEGSFYVSDGYGNSRIIKFSSTGKYLFEWGKKGNGESEFNIPHSLSIDSNENVYVADRENNRIQVFDKNGKFIKQFSDKTFANISSVAFDEKHKTLFATDDLSFLKFKHRGSDINAIDSLGILQQRFGRSGFYNGSVCWYHDIVIDNEQNIYVGDILNNRVQKFKKK